MEEHLNPIDFTVPLSHSKLFDTLAQNTAAKLCSQFPGLQMDVGEDKIRIFGQLNDFWYKKWNLAFFEIGSLDVDLGK